MPHEPTADQRTALAVARQAQRKFERAEAAYRRASDERAQAFTAALEAGWTYRELADAFGWPHRSNVQAAAEGRTRRR
jgi:DNA-directed RNA polymerase specialized sigma24 family protein